MLIRKNKKIGMRNFICIMLGVVMAASLFSCPVTYASNGGSEYLIAAKEIIEWKKDSLHIPRKEDLFSKQFLTGAGTSSADWYAIAMGRLGFSNSYYAYIDVAEKNIVDRYQSKDQLDRIRATEWHRSGLAILSCGGDPTQLKDGKINLVQDGSYNRGKKMPLAAQGNNALFWGLILMDAMRYKIPDDAVDHRENVIQSILEKQHMDGGFTFGGKSSPDATGMALQALAPYYNSMETTRVAIDKAIKYLSNEQQSNGRLLSGGEENCESIVQAIIGLCSVGINPDVDERFVKDGHSLVQAMMSFRQPDGGFGHLPNQEKSDSIASEQVLLALTALDRFDKRLHNLYDFRNEPNVGIKELISDLDDQIGELGENPDSNIVEVLANNFLVIPIEERSYVRNYSILINTMNELNIPDHSVDLFRGMNQNSSGNGYIINLLDEMEVNSQEYKQVDQNPLKENQEIKKVKNKSRTEITVKKIFLIVVEIFIASVLIWCIYRFRINKCKRFKKEKTHVQ